MMEINLEALRRQSRVAAFIAALATVVVLGALYISFHQTVGAKQELQSVQTIEKQRTNENVTLRSDIGNLKSEKNKYVEAINATVGKSPQAAKAFAETVTASPDLAAAIPRIFIHMNGSSNVALARKIQKDLKVQGFVVPTPDSIPPINGPVPAWRLHYYFQDPVSSADIKKIQAVFDANQIQLSASFSSPHPGPPRRTYALYLGNN